MLKEIVIHIVGLIGVVLQPASGQAKATATLLSVHTAGHEAKLQIPVGFIDKIEKNGEEYTPNYRVFYGADGAQALTLPLDGYNVSFSGLKLDGVTTTEVVVTPRPEKPVFADLRYPQWGDLAWLPDLKRAYQEGGNAGYWTVKSDCLNGNTTVCKTLGSLWSLAGGSLRTSPAFYLKYQGLPFFHGASNRHVFADRLEWRSSVQSSVSITLEPLQGAKKDKYVIHLRERQSTLADDDEPILTFSNLPTWTGEDTQRLSHFAHLHDLTEATPNDVAIPCSGESKDCGSANKIELAALRKRLRSDGLLFAEPIICPPARLYAR